MKKVEGDELARALEGLPEWMEEGGRLVRTFHFTDFIQAMHFVNEVAAIAEQMNHHPDLDIRYNKVRVALMTHDAGGITDRDLRQALKLDGMPR